MRLSGIYLICEQTLVFWTAGGPNVDLVETHAPLGEAVHVTAAPMWDKGRWKALPG